LFMGILLYFKKYMMLKSLGEMINIKKQADELRMCTTVPQNWQNWLNVRRIIASANEQAFVIIDINKSAVLFYTLFLLFEVIFEKMGILPGFFTDFDEILKENASLQSIVNGTIIVIMVVLILDVTIGLLINFLFTDDQKNISLHKFISKGIAFKHDLYEEEKIMANTDNDVYLGKLKEIREFSGSEGLKDKMSVYLARLVGAIKLALDGTKAEETDNPHSILGIPTRTAEVALMGTLLSAIGINTIANSIVRN